MRVKVELQELDDGFAANLKLFFFLFKKLFENSFTTIFLIFFCLKNKLIIYEEGETKVTPANWKVKKEDKYNNKKSSSVPAKKKLQSKGLNVC